MAKEKEKGKGKAGKGDKPELVVSIAQHPRAKAGIRRARTRGALIVFALVLVLNLIGDQDLFDAVWRALLAGIVVNVIVWRCAIVVWRHILKSELDALRDAREERAREQREAYERARAEAEAANAANAK